MKKYRLYQVDSFTKNPFIGNPAGVVANADGLTEAQMKQIAREMNNSETAFIFSSDSPDYDIEIRFFTPKAEVPLCGHATIASHYIRAMEGTAAPGRHIQKTKAGLLPVDIICSNGGYSIIMTQGKPKIYPPYDGDIVSKIADGLGISVSDIREDCPVAKASAGHSKIMIGIKSLDRLHSLEPDMNCLATLSKDIGCNGYYVFTLHPGEKYLAHGRMFSPAIGVMEDAVTGNANGPLGLYLSHYGICKELEQADSFDFDIIQGEAIGRPGTMHVHVKKENGKPVLSQIYGTAVVVFSSVIEL